MKHVLSLLLLLGLSTPLTAQDLIIVVSKKSPIKEISLFQLREIYLGNMKRLAGKTVRPIHVKPDDPLRHAFEDLVFPANFDAEEYWQNSKLQGGPDPPPAVRGWGLVSAYIAKNPGFVGYLPAEKITEVEAMQLKVVTVAGD
ncbi:hypothetical protein [Acanthopleuribacter pedis]|uniref:Phosphate ABC transporter substrate-binding protein n=1 Tax=Acanthopleuribacter pedis TaxID=442870 RepID=A0A8J7U0U7_9BACT|nr:hypothetical protein [Acanthopleuribacter pedis]MBO1317463.1 hypothetical protein [Acanthopleuribacter pedis]